MCEQCTREWDFQADIAINTQACRKAWMLFPGKLPPFLWSIHFLLAKASQCLVCSSVCAHMLMVVVPGPVRWELWGFWQVRRRHGGLWQANETAGKRWRRRRRLSVLRQEQEIRSPSPRLPQRSGEKWDERSRTGAGMSFGCPDEMWEWLWAVGLWAWPFALPPWPGGLWRSERGNGHRFNNTHPNYGRRTSLPIWWFGLARYKILHPSNRQSFNHSGR